MVARLGPGSPAPANPAEVEALLRMVPVVAFLPELEPLLPAPLGQGPLTPKALTEGADPTWLARVAEALRHLEARAEAQADGALRFLAVTLRHFLEVERIPAREHPLVVALFARTDARRRAEPDHPNPDHPHPDHPHPDHPHPDHPHPDHPHPDHPHEVARVLDGW